MSHSSDKNRVGEMGNDADDVHCERGVWIVDPKLRKCLLSYAYELLGNWHDAEDAVTETIIVVWERYDPNHKKADIRKFVFSVCYNQCRTCSRYQRSRLLLLESEHFLLNQKSSFLLEDLEDKEQRECLRSWVEQLPLRQRQVFQLRFEEGLSPAEIAEILARKPNAVYNSFYEAMEKLRMFAQQDYN